MPMRMPSLAQASVVGIVAGIGSGALTALIKGSGGGVRYDLGNDIALWLLLPTAIGAMTKDAVRSIRMACSVLATVAAFVAFYVITDAFTVEPWRHVYVNRFFFMTTGTIAAAIFSSMVAALARRNVWYGVMLLGAVGLLEPLVEPMFGKGSSGRPEVFASEGAVAVLAMVLSCVRIYCSGRGEISADRQ